jgi:predicted transcriptional regulator
MFSGHVAGAGWCWYVCSMTKLLETAIDRIRQWPDERQTEIAEMLLALDGDDFDDEVDAETLAAIDNGLAQAERGEFVDPKDFDEIFSRYRT